jgi:hypothetical protein
MHEREVEAFPQIMTSYFCELCYTCIEVTVSKLRTAAFRLSFWDALESLSCQYISPVVRRLSGLRVHQDAETCILRHSNPFRSTPAIIRKLVALQMIIKINYQVAERILSRKSGITDMKMNQSSSIFFCSLVNLLKISLKLHISEWGFQEVKINNGLACQIYHVHTIILSWISRISSAEKREAPPSWYYNLLTWQTDRRKDKHGSWRMH